MRKIVIFLLAFMVCVAYTPIAIRADEYDQITKELEDTRRLLDMSVSATKTNEQQMNSLNSKVADLRARVQALEQDLAQKSAEIEDGNEVFAQTEKTLSSKMSEHYKRLVARKTSLLPMLLSSRLSSAIDAAVYQQLVVEKDQKHIVRVALQINNLESARATIQQHRAQLEGIKSELARQSDFLSGEVASAKAYQQSLTQKIVELSTRQQAIIAARSAQVSASIGGDELEYDDFNASREYSPPFSPAFAAFSIGAYTHRNGMSQYGAKGRAEAGQSAEQILAHYYPGATLNKSYASPDTISVDGYGMRSFEDEYMKRIYEMPNSFPKEALKAQAVAARTYAIRRGGSICATESCQVYKDQNKGGAWEEAVNETRGWVLEGGPSAQYSSTTGGYLNTSGWDTIDGSGNNFLDNAWERKAKSPWFYKAWYRIAYSNASNSCGRASPWLTQEEFADILNAWLVRSNGSSEQVARIVPTTINECNIGGSGGNPFSMGELAQLADSYGGRFHTIQSVSVQFASNGSAGQVVMETNKGPITISGSDFKQIFNLRAPGYISIRNALFNIEKK
ncbi:MAG TPA: SpoIID/LytB domain-containing protein [Candidatus Woesebacteria bacterium]|nr:SpoIID/LytB domain-containing protein [Candidatus Woesebacteria bacterium]HNS94761.1 SpoIID/LytB domain-containing protein [Candidatus Woesebacteria bacterium]